MTIRPKHFIFGTLVFALLGSGLAFSETPTTTTTTPVVAVKPEATKTTAVVVNKAGKKNNPIGKWRARKGKVTVDISMCQGDKLCATIIALKKPKNKQGKIKTDSENPVESLRTRPIIGIQVVSGMVKTTKNKWEGKIYNPDDGRTYPAEATFSGNKLIIEACWGPFCKKNRFTRAK